MAVTQKNVIEDVIIGSYQDKITPGLSKSTQAIKKQMDTVVTGATAMAGSLVALFSFREIKQGFRELTNFAREHYTQSTALVRQLDTAWNKLMTIIVNSETFKKTIEKAIGFLDITSVMLTNFKALDMFGKVVTTQVNLWFMVVSNFFVNVFGKLVERFNIFLLAYNEVRSWFDSDFEPVTLFSQPFDDIQVFKAMSESFTAMDEFEKFVQTNKSGIKASGKASGMITEKQNIPRPEAITPYEPEKYRTEYEKIAAIEKHYQDRRIIEAEQTTANLAEIGWALVNENGKMVMKNIAYEEQLAEARATMKEQFQSGFVQAFVNGFAAMGQAIVEGENVLKAFVANFLSAIGQMAVQFGSMMILYGIAGQAVPFLGISGGAAIAAGAALVVFGGALTALAGTMQKTATAGSASGNYRPDSSFDGGQRAGNTTVTVIVQALDPSSIGDSVLRNLGLKVGKELQKQEYLGRSLAFGGG